MTTTDEILKFAHFNSAVDASFWQSFVEKKLDELKLSEESLSIVGHYNAGTFALTEQGQQKPMPSRFTIPAKGLSEEEETSLSGQSATTPPLLYCKGELFNTNTIEEFRTIDKNQLFQRATEKIVHAVQSGQALENPNLLSSFLLVTFADLKKYKFYYWFAFPALMPYPAPWMICQTTAALQLDSFGEAYQSYSKSVPNNQSCYFLVNPQTNGKVRVTSLREYESFFASVALENRIVGFVDPSSEDNVPGWPLKNLLYLLKKAFDVSKIKILCYRPNNTKKPFILLETQLPESSSYDDIKSVGWERNVQGKLGPRMADLGSLMDPQRLADTSVDLNLKLMRWRLLPDLDLEKIKQTKCLLLGAGTLGCYVARCLIGWGVRHITFVDNGSVSFSNPVRQPLYLFQDALHGGAPKAEIAAHNLKSIQPTMHAEGHALSIPMPGHYNYANDEKLQQDVDALAGLVESHDVVFLLTDSRESRWLPTLLAAKYNKVCLNSALGFDTYLVMRHGARGKNSTHQLGCYFCNDIVAPADSLTDRTLDQQCTVTRPGLAAIAGALSVELMVSLIQHPDGINAKADTSNSQTPSSILGLLPHQIRGFLGQFNNMLIVGQAYEKCTACSEKVLEAFDKDRLGFMKQVLKDPLYLETLTGLAAMKAESEALLQDQDWAADEFSDNDQSDF